MARLAGTGGNWNEYSAAAGSSGFLACYRGTKLPPKLTKNGTATTSGKGYPVFAVAATELCRFLHRQTDSPVCRDFNRMRLQTLLLALVSAPQIVF